MSERPAVGVAEVAWIDGTRLNVYASESLRVSVGEGAAPLALVVVRESDPASLADAIALDSGTRAVTAVEALPAALTDDGFLTGDVFGVRARETCAVGSREEPILVASVSMAEALPADLVERQADIDGSRENVSQREVLPAVAVEDAAPDVRVAITEPVRVTVSEVGRYVVAILATDTVTAGLTEPVSTRVV